MLYALAPYYASTIRQGIVRAYYDCAGLKTGKPCTILTQRSETEAIIYYTSLTVYNCTLGFRIRTCADARENGLVIALCAYVRPPCSRKWLCRLLLT